MRRGEQEIFREGAFVEEVYADEMRRRLREWYEREKRQLPWRETTDPYRIWISEVILQQTRVAQGVDYYLRFIERFPTVQQLADASEDEVLRLWQGLGYYSRARNLHAASRQISDLYQGVYPSQYEQVRGLRGVGDYTAAALCSIAYGLPYATVDGNVYRVLARLFRIATPIDTPAGHRKFARIAYELLDRECPGRYNQALMELGALLCTPHAPSCDACPLEALCQARGSGAEAFPVKRAKVVVTARYFNYLHLCRGNQTLLVRREGGDIWQGLYEFPLIETPQAVDFDALREDPRFGEWVLDDAFVLRKTTVMPKHQLSHRTLYARFYRLEVSAFPAGGTVIDAEQLDRFAVSRLTERYLERK